jgi:hypothetical protein
MMGIQGESLGRFLRQLRFEAALSFLLGAVPIFLAALANNTGVLEKAIQALMPRGYGMWFVICLSLTSLCYLGIVAVYPPRDKPGFITRVFLETYKESRTVLRVAAGILLSFSLIWLKMDYAHTDWKLAWFVGFGLVALIEGTFFSLFIEWLEARPGLAP